MKFLSTRGGIAKIDIRQSRWPRKSKEDSKSYFQWRVGQIIDDVFPDEVVLEEFSIPMERLFVDFFLPRKKIVIEAHGNQHFTYNKFFHGSWENFTMSKLRDKRKELWCEINNLRLVIIKECDDEEIIRHKLLSDNT